MQEVVANEGVVNVCREWPFVCSSLAALLRGLAHSSLPDGKPLCLPIHTSASLCLCPWVPKELD